MTNPVAVQPGAEPVSAIPVTVPMPAAPRGRPGIAIGVEPFAWAFVIGVAALYRLVDLSVLPLRPDESLAARAALDFARGDVTSDWRGDLTSALAALVFKLAGDSETTARVVPALLGVLSVAALALYRPLVGRAAALIGALLVAVSPVAVLAARTLGPEAAALPLALALPPLADSIWMDGRVRRLPLLTATVGLGMGTGALVPAVGLVVVAWLAIELVWLDGRARRDGACAGLSARLLLGSAATALPGLALAMWRYGAGPERVSSAAVRAWDGPSPLARPPESWHHLLDVFAGYEPLLLVLGAAGLVLTLRHWSRPGNAGGRLLAVWTIGGGAVVALWLHRDPAQLQALTVPLALLAAVATVRLSAGVTNARLRRTGLALLPLVPAVGFFLVMAVHWAYRDRILGAEALAVAFTVAGGVVAAALVGWLVRAPASGVALAAAWLLLGGLTLHATANLAYGGGAELLTGQRTRVEVGAIVRDLNALVEPGEAVWVERRLWPALAWPLRDRPVTPFVETPPAAPAVVPAHGRDVEADTAQNGVPVSERWSRTNWDLLGILRWWVARTPWGSTDVQRATVVDR